jgi:hypothetical protein
MPTFLSGWCPECRAPIRIAARQPPLELECPTCGRIINSEAALAGARQSRRELLAWSVVAVVVLISLATLGYVFRGHVLSALDFVAEATGDRLTALAALVGGLVVLLWLVLWLLFPIIVYLGLKDLRRRTTELDQTTRLCVRHLAQLTAERDSPCDQKEPETKVDSA